MSGTLPHYSDGLPLPASQLNADVDDINTLATLSVSIKSFGAVGDAVLTGSTWSGTDNTPFIAAALTKAFSTGRPLYIPTGKYFCATGNPLNMTGTIATGLTVFGDGLDQSFLVYLDTSPCIGTPNQGTSRMPFLNLHDFGLIGPGLALTVQGSWNAIQLQNVDKVVIKSISVDRSAVMCMSGRHSKDVLIQDCRLTNSYRDGINFDSSYIRVIGNQLNHVGDDGIACTSMTGDTTDFPARDGIVVSGNVLSDSNGIVCISARGASITGNTGNRIKGRFIVIGNSSGSEGATPAHGVNIVGNVCRDMITYNLINPYFVNIASTNPRIGSNPVTAAIPGFPSSAGEMVSPYPFLRNNTTDQTVPMPPGYAYNIVGNTFATTLPFSTLSSITTNSSAQFATGVTSITVASAAGISNGFKVSGGNIALGTTVTSVVGTTIGLSLPTTGIVLNGVPQTFTDPSVGMMSDLGWGLVMTNHGFMDVPLTAAAVRATQALFFTQESPVGIVQGVNFTGNMISGVQYGIYIKPGVQVIDCLISNNVWRDILSNGFVSIVTQAAFNRITIDGDIWDGDPYFQGTHRNVIGTGGDGGNEYDGTWTTTSGATPVFSLNTVNGLTVKNSVFRNWATLYSSKPAGTVWENNTLVCNPVGVGFNVGNAGISSLPAPTSDLKYKIEDSNPASATYGQLLNDCPVQAAAVPSSGTWVAGTVVTNNAVGGTKALAGNQTVATAWLRITTGSGNVLGTDWFPIFATPNPVPRIVLSGALTIGATDFIVIANKTVGSATACGLIASPVTGMQVIIKDGKGDAAANNITITPNAGTIDGAATLVINTNFGVARLVYNGTQWNAW